MQQASVRPHIRLRKPTQTVTKSKSSLYTWGCMYCMPPALTSDLYVFGHAGEGYHDPEQLQREVGDQERRLSNAQDARELRGRQLLIATKEFESAAAELER